MDRLFLTFWLPDGNSFQSEDFGVLPPVGTFVFHSGTSYVVSRVWFIHEKHGAMGFGWNVFLDRSREGYELLKAFDPAYYR